MVENRVGVRNAASSELDDAFVRIWTLFDAGELLTACAWCGRVQIDGTWLFPPRAALAAIDTRHMVSHSICDECAPSQEVLR